MSTLPRHDALLFAALFNERGVLATLVVGQFIAIILAFAPTTADDIWLRLGILSLFIHLTFLSCISCLYVARNKLVNHSHRIQILFFIASLILITSVFSAVFYNYASTFTDLPGVGVFILRNDFIVFLVSALFIQFFLIHVERDQQTSALARAELDALQARIRPHFLFNSLNTAAELTHHDPEAAEQAILALASLSQAAMKAGKSTPLNEEIALTQQYISLEKWRFGERLRVNWQLPRELPSLLIPCLTLQPILENAVCHGVEPSPNGAKIEVQLYITDKSLTFIVQNPIPSTVLASRKNNGMALDNIRKRLSLYYRHKAKLTTHEAKGVFRVKLILPKSHEQLT